MEPRSGRQRAQFAPRVADFGARLSSAPAARRSASRAPQFPEKVPTNEEVDALITKSSKAAQATDTAVGGLLAGRFTEILERILPLGSAPDSTRNAVMELVTWTLTMSDGGTLDAAALRTLFDQRTAGDLPLESQRRQMLAAAKAAEQRAEEALAAIQLEQHHRSLRHEEVERRAEKAELKAAKEAQISLLSAREKIAEASKASSTAACACSTAICARSTAICACSTAACCF